MSKKLSYQDRVRLAVKSAINQRLHLIAQDKSKSEITKDDCLTLQQKMELLRSASQFQAFVLVNFDMLYRMIPATNRPARANLIALSNEKIH